LAARPYLNLLIPLLESSVRRSIILVGPRRVGKTVMLHHLVRDMLKKGKDSRGIAYLSIDHPIYNGMGLKACFPWLKQRHRFRRARSGS